MEPSWVHSYHRVGIFQWKAPPVKTILRFDLLEENNAQEMGHNIQILSSAANWRSTKRGFHYTSSVQLNKEISVMVYT